MNISKSCFFCCCIRKYFSLKKSCLQKNSVKNSSAKLFEKDPSGRRRIHLVGVFLVLIFGLHDSISVMVESDISSPVVEELDVYKLVVERTAILKYFMTKKKLILWDNLFDWIG